MEHPSWFLSIFLFVSRLNFQLPISSEEIFLYFFIFLRKFMKKFVLLISSFLLAQLFTSCGSSIDSTDNRYKHAAEEKITAAEKPHASLVEDFDFSPYSLQIEKTKKDSSEAKPDDDDLWRNYPRIDNSQKETIHQPGYRVQVMATDDLDEAQQMRSDIYFKTNKSDIYIAFQPPLYKVKVGDYATQSGANTLVFKLNQLGFPLTQVVADTVNIRK